MLLQSTKKALHKIYSTISAKADIGYAHADLIAQVSLQDQRSRLSLSTNRNHVRWSHEI